MKNLLRLVASAAFSLILVSGVSLSLIGCSADSLSGPNYEASVAGDPASGGTDGGAGSEHNLDKANVEGASGGTDGGAGSEHNTDG